jgi:phage terminase large subunit
LKIRFNCYGNRSQEALWRAWADPAKTDIYFGGAKGGGKTYIGCAAIFGDAMMYPGTRYFIARYELGDLRKFTIPTIHEVFERSFQLNIDDHCRYNGQDNFWEFTNGSRVLFLSGAYLPSDPLFERFGSMQFTRKTTPTT